MQQADTSEILWGLAEASRIERDSTMKLTEMIQPWFIALFLIAASAFLMFANVPWLSSHLPEVPLKLADPLMIAGILALVVDPLLKRQLLREVSQNAFAHLIGFDHEPELKQRLRSMVFDTKLYRKDLYLDCEVRPCDSGATLTIKSRCEVLNQSLEPQSYAPYWEFDETDSPFGCSLSVIVGDTQKENLLPKASKRAGHVVLEASKKISIQPRSKNTRYIFESEVSFHVPKNYYHPIYASIPTINTNIELRALDGWQVWIGDSTSRQSQDSLHEAKIFMQGDHIELHWRQPD
jgi:hypothetical protein